ncbi:hypothetical protein RJ641_028805 [Dillenia turbinata]|uniref:tRNA pseudouridine(55) synthase n=1 Tax=Dillenia turbinata TaxID=194707 RepID=A0AAN8VWY7_9MAGN
MEELQDSKRCPEDGGSMGHANSDGPFPQGIEAELTFCCICFGILQFYCYDDKNMLVSKSSANEFALSIGQLIKQEGYEIDNVQTHWVQSLVIIRSYLKEKYGSECCWQEKLSTTCISVNDALKLSIASSLESLLMRLKLRRMSNLLLERNDVCRMSNLLLERNDDRKRKRTGMFSLYVIVASCCPNSFNSHLEAQVEGSDSSTSKSNYIKINSSDVSESNKLLAEKEYQPCHLELHCYRTPVYIGGKYLKYSRNVSQTCWIIDDKRKGEASIEVLQMLSLLVLVAILVWLFKVVGVKNLKLVGSEGWNLMCEGEAEKQKQYAALVWMSCLLEDDDLKKISSLTDMKILQKTPIRALHRRSPLEREKIVHWQEHTSRNLFMGILDAPELGCAAEILELDVTDAKMECF